MSTKKRYEDNDPVTRVAEALCCASCGSVRSVRFDATPWHAADLEGARWCCGRHDRPCATEGCKERTTQHYTHCDACRERRASERYLALPAEEWGGESMVYSEATGDYYESPDYALDCADEGATVESLRLVLCKHPTPQCVDLVELLGEDLEDPENTMDDALLKVAQEAVDALAKDTAMCTWVPRDVRLRARGGYREEDSA